MTCQALLIDISGKQRYIFNSNKLKLNIGASHIMAYEIFGDILKESLKVCADSLETNLYFEEWKCKQNGYSILLDDSHKICVGYIGGGNALILFESGICVKKFIEIYSYDLLKAYPGLNPVFAVIDKFDTDNLKVSRDELNDEINRNKSFYFTHTTPFKHGIEQDCSLTGNAREVYNTTLKSWVSKEADTKVEKCSISQSALSKEFKDQLGNQFAFSDELEDLSPEEKKRYVAVVHLDGNGMGKEFLSKEKLSELRELSVQVTDKLDASLKELVKHIISLFQIKGTGKDEVCVCTKDESVKLKKENGKYILPIRPIINAGDDITFVCHGKLGIHLAEKYMEILKNEKVGDKSIPSCAGVAIFHTKYPFYRMYQMAEELASNAKNTARNHVGTCWLQFLISSEGKIDHLDTILETFKGKMKGPYQLGASFNDLKAQTKTLTDLTKWSKNRVAEHREMHFASEPDKEFWKLHLQNRGVIKKEEDPFENFTYDAIEMIDFYPTHLL